MDFPSPAAMDGPEGVASAWRTRHPESVDQNRSTAIRMDPPFAPPMIADCFADRRRPSFRRIARQRRDGGAWSATRSYVPSCSRCTSRRARERFICACAGSTPHFWHKVSSVSVFAGVEFWVVAPASGINGFEGTGRTLASKSFAIAGVNPRGPGGRFCRSGETYRREAARGPGCSLAVHQHAGRSAQRAVIRIQNVWSRTH